MVNAFISHVVQSVGWDPSQYTAHSLRAGAATTAAKAGFKEWELKKMGGWESQTYVSYIRDNGAHAANFASRLVHS